MNKKNWIVIVFIIFIFIGLGIFFFIKNNNTNNTLYEANKTSTNINNTTNKISDKQQIFEEEIASFSTKIYSQDSARQNNINITCKTLNGAIVKKGETFSFCNTIGPSTTSKGYKEADIFDKNGKKKKGLGGGNCQISTTLYNAVLSIPSINITERHAHSNDVPYIEEGKDAAVAYGSYDLKFVNNTNNDVKIYSECSDSSVTVKIISLKPL